MLVYSLINACRKVQFQTNLMNRYKEFKNVDFGPKNALNTPIKHTIRIFLQKKELHHFQLFMEH